LRFPPTHITIRGAVLSLVALTGLAAIVAASPARGTQSSNARPPGTTYTGNAFTFNKVQDGVYHAVGTGALVVGCNASIVVNADDVLVVDTHMTPGGAWALREELRSITTRPVRYVVNSHWHFDHAHGNQIYGPETEIIGHEFTRRMITSGESIKGRAYDLFVGAIPGQIKTIEGRIAAATDPAERAKLQAQLAVQQNHLEGTKAVVPKPPTVTLIDQLTLYRGGREIRLLFLGRGHTGGDVVVFLPKERLLMTGDLLVEGTSYTGDAYFTEWIETLERVKALEFDRVLPGHGRVVEGKAKFDHFQAYLRDFWSQAQALHKAGVPAEEAAKRIDMRPHAKNYPTITAAGVQVNGVLRAYELIEGKVR
jgi:glyoxylase-like metal-dependent hydrolase (beta-lactamase superfamily II)